ncbi:MAG: type II/IV secretion system ATPase subunit [Crenarchaeota archaeon]|nr:type II/IV secretion system ATPase subunit [Thermoproteota archaeon]
MNRIMGDVKLLSHFSKLTGVDEGIEEAIELLKPMAKKKLKKGVISEDELYAVAYYISRDLVGYGKIDPLLRDPHIEDITCDGVAIPIYVFHNEYEWLETNIVFTSVEELERVIRKLAHRAGVEPTFAQPIVEGVIRPEGYRLHVVLDVVSRRGHSFTIRRFREVPFTMVELIQRRMLDPALAAFLWLVAENRQGIVIYGPTGAGKTTLLNAIAMLLPPEVKIVTAEDTPEISLPFHDNWVAMTTRLSTDPYVQSVSLQAQVESALRQRPDVLILGEIRSREAYSFFQAVSTGHGGLTTVHAESVEALIRRLSSPPMSVPKSLIATARLFVGVLRLALPSGVTRRVVYVHEVEGYDPRRDSIKIKLEARWFRNEDLWKMDLKTSTSIEAIASLNALNYNDVVEDLIKRSTILWWAAMKGLDIVALHTLVRRYRRNPDEVYKKVLSEVEKPYEAIQLDTIERLEI